MNSSKEHWIQWQINFDVFFHKFTFSAEQVTSRQTFSARGGGGGGDAPAINKSQVNHFLSAFTTFSDSF